MLFHNLSRVFKPDCLFIYYTRSTRVSINSKHTPRVPLQQICVIGQKCENQVGAPLITWWVQVQGRRGCGGGLLIVAARFRRQIKGLCSDLLGASRSKRRFSFLKMSFNSTVMFLGQTPWERWTLSGAILLPDFVIPVLSYLFVAQGPRRIELRPTSYYIRPRQAFIMHR